MGTTPNLKLTYPEFSDQADGPAAFNSLATGVESYFYNRTLPSGITRAPSYYWGTVNAYPTANLQPGDTCTLGGVLYEYTGTTGGWVNTGRQLYVQSADPGAVPDGSIWFQPTG